MVFEQIQYEVAAGIATITLNRPDKRNALSDAMIAEVGQALVEMRADPGARVLVLRGAGDKAFSAGGDLSAMFATKSVYDQYTSKNPFVEMFRTLTDLGKPTIACVKGLALAGGLGLATACDFVLAAADARFGTTEVKVGLFPMMISPIIIRNVGRKATLKLLLTGEIIDAPEAKRIGLITDYYPAEELDEQVNKLADQLRSKSREVLGLGLKAFNTMADMEFSQALRFLQAMLAINLSADDTAEGLKAFLEKRKPNWD